MINALYILIAIVILGVIVTVHEFGHFVVGRLTGISVEEFSIGMGPRIFGRSGKKTAFSLRLIPLGGYCRFKGEDGEDDAPDAMNNQPVWKRFLTVLAGPVMNFLFAYLVCAILLACVTIYAEYLPRVEKLYDDTPAAESGLAEGDIITSVNGVAISYDGDGTSLLQSTIRSADLSTPLSLTVSRNGETEAILVTPAQVTDPDTGAVSYQIGIALGGRRFRAMEYMVSFTGDMLRALKNLFFRGEGISDTMGPVGIIYTVSQSVREGWNMVLYLIFIISLNLGIMNLLPLPALDGGRLVFLAIEGIRRKPIPREKEGMVHAIGFAALLLLILFFTYQDILRIFRS